MPKRITNPNSASVGKREGRQAVAPNVTSPGEFWTNMKAMIAGQRFRVVVGVILVAITIMLLIAYISFFLTGANDFSVISQIDTRCANRQDIQNALGLPGAIVARWLVDGTFGVIIILPILLLGVVAMQLIHRFSFPMWRSLFITLFSLAWISVLLGYIQSWLSIPCFFRWGGVHGEWLSSLAVSYTHGIGLLLILAATLIIFLVLIDRHFIEKCSALWTRLTTPSAKNIESDSTEEETDATPVITLDVVGGEDTLVPPVKEQDEIIIEIEKPEVEDDTAIAEEKNNEDDDIMVEDVDTPASDTGLDIVEPTEVEMVEKQSESMWENLPPYDPRKDLELFRFPGLDLLKVYDNETAPIIDQAEQQANANRIVTTLRNFDIEIESIKATVGPTVTLYEIVPKAGIKIAKIQNLESDIMLSLAAKGIRIIAPMPGKGTIGIEVPNEKPQVVSMHSVVASKRFQEEKKMRLPIVIGRTITNEVFMFDLAKTPHLLVAGATGQGKSVAINAIITSLLYKKHPAELKFVLVDPKMVEFAPYKDLMRHYLAAMPETDPNKIIITDCAEVINTLNSLVIEMENRYKLLMDAGVRNLEDYNEKFVSRRLNPEKLVDGQLHHQYLPYIVIVIDEYGDFIMQVGKQVETPIARITQKARAVGMHMILATQRPSVNIVTGVIKANIPTRIALRTQSVVDSRTVLDAKGADQLIGRGDMLYSGNGEITRIQCAFVDTPEVDDIVKHVSQQQHYTEPYPLPEYIPEGAEGEALTPGSVDMRHLDPMFADVARYVVSKQEGSTSRLQRAFEIGYNRAGKLSDQLEAAGIVGPNKGPKGRDVLIQDMDTLNTLLASLES